MRGSNPRIPLFSRNIKLEVGSGLVNHYYNNATRTLLEFVSQIDVQYHKAFISQFGESQGSCDGS
jgi:hypothetical protein